jgi:hypothetical protein
LEVCVYDTKNNQEVFVKVTLITDTYSDEEIVKSFIIVSLYDATTLSANIAEQAVNAKIDINNAIGRTTDFTVSELEEIRNEPIVLSASQYTAYLLQRKPQERAAKLTEDTILDGGEAWNRLKLWMINNGIIPPSERKVKKSISDVNIQWCDRTYVILGEEQ